MNSVRMLYFSWIRERVGTGEETVDLPAGIATVADLLGHLRTHDPRFESVLDTPDVIRVALDHEHVQHSAPIGGAREIALFPPMTGG